MRLVADIDPSVQVNIPAESGEMGILASHVPSIEQLKPGIVEIIEESSGSKQFFRTSYRDMRKSWMQNRQISNGVHENQSRQD